MKGEAGTRVLRPVPTRVLVPASRVVLPTPMPELPPPSPPARVVLGAFRKASKIPVSPSSASSSPRDDEPVGSPRPRPRHHVRDEDESDPALPTTVDTGTVPFVGDTQNMPVLNLPSWTQIPMPVYVLGALVLGCVGYTVWGLFFRKKG